MVRDESETQTVGKDDEEVQNAQDNYDDEDESDDNNVIVEGDTDEYFGTRDNHYHNISNNENNQKFSSVMFPLMKSTICY